MKSFTLATITAVLLTATAAAGSSAEIKVIANASIAVSEISGDELRRVFLATKTTLDDGTHIEPVLEKDGAVHETFLKQFIGKTSSALDTYYRSLAFTGKGSIPKAFGSDSEVAAYVARTKGAIGYVSASSNTAGVKILEVR